MPMRTFPPQLDEWQSPKDVLPLSAVQDIAENAGRDCSGVMHADSALLLSTATSGREQATFTFTGNAVSIYGAVLNTGAAQNQYATYFDVESSLLVHNYTDPSCASILFSLDGLDPTSQHHLVLSLDSTLVPHPAQYLAIYVAAVPSADPTSSTVSITSLSASSGVVVPAPATTSTVTENPSSVPSPLADAQPTDPSNDSNASSTSDPTADPRPTDSSPSQVSSGSNSDGHASSSGQTASSNRTLLVLVILSAVIATAGIIAVLLFLCRRRRRRARRSLRKPDLDAFHPFLVAQPPETGERPHNSLPSMRISAGATSQSREETRRLLYPRPGPLPAPPNRVQHHHFFADTARPGDIIQGHPVRIPLPAPGLWEDPPSRSAPRDTQPSADTVKRRDEKQRLALSPLQIPSSGQSSSRFVQEPPAGTVQRRHEKGRTLQSSSSEPLRSPDSAYSTSSLSTPTLQKEDVDVPLLRARPEEDNHHEDDPPPRYA